MLKAFSHMKSWVLGSFKRSGEMERIPHRPFQFSEVGKLGKSMFEVFFEIDNQEYQYGYRADAHKIYEEWLYKRDFRFKSKYNLVFEREAQKFNLSNELKKTKELLISINERTLLVSVLSSLRITDANNVSKWFKETAVIDFGNVFYELIISRGIRKVDFEDPIAYKRLLDFLNAIDVGILGIRVEELGEAHDDLENESKRSYKVFTQHLNTDTDKIEEIPLQEESSGTLKTLSLYYYLDDALKKGRTLFVDELDAKLHPLLTRFIINLFQSDEANPNNAQLILTTHDSNTLSKELFRRDQIWFSEKDYAGISSLFSLVEYKINDKKIRKDASYSKDYLGGRYGAVPDFKEYKGSE